MKVLFVCSGNSLLGISPLVKSQGESLRRNGIEVEYFAFKGNFLGGYPAGILNLRKFLKSRKFDVIHAHYSISAFAATFAGASPLVVSLMGDDVKGSFIMKSFIRFLHKHRWKAVIVKSERMKNDIKIPDALVVPNGVDFEKFKFIDKKTARDKVNFNDKKHIIFVATHDSKSKNPRLAYDAYKLLNNRNVELNIVKGIDPELIPYYMYAADVLILTSLSEGSPNVIKEAMACNLPIVSTDAGDAAQVISKTPGCFLASYDPADFADKIIKAINFGKSTGGRDNIKHLDINAVARKIIDIYKKVI
ncbi:MAG: glycosyltransferase family 4 protein [Sedimentisphaerales bacterium]|jgi:glycosyltransferase involved in cell wall biosynthesis